LVSLPEFGQQHQDTFSASTAQKLLHCVGETIFKLLGLHAGDASGFMFEERLAFLQFTVFTVEFLQRLASSTCNPDCSFTRTVL